MGAEGNWSVPGPRGCAVGEVTRSATLPGGDMDSTHYVSLREQKEIDAISQLGEIEMDSVVPHFLTLNAHLENPIIRCK